VTGRAQQLLAKLDRGETLDLRGLGKAGGGLLLAVQSFGSAVASQGELDVQDWPLFSSARKGANVTGFLRIARGRIEKACQVTEPDIALLMNEAAAEETDFAEGATDALFVINTALSPEEAAARWRLGGTVATVDGDTLGLKHLSRPLANMAVFAALVRSTGLVAPESARASLEKSLRKRRLPERLVSANLALYDEAQSGLRIADFPASATTRHPRPAFQGYGWLPAGAQSALRTSRANHTASYGRPGVRVSLSDPQGKCNGCALCVAQCPEGVIALARTEAGGFRVSPEAFARDTAPYCKVCRECVNACPHHLFQETEVRSPQQ